MTRLASLVRIFGREACWDPRFVDWLTKAIGRPEGTSS
jgi:hypothetical protein